jgi:hypothetical protein
MEISFGVGQEEVFDNALLGLRIIIQEEGRYVLASTPSVRVRGARGGRLRKYTRTLRIIAAEYVTQEIPAVLALPELSLLLE